MAWFRKKEEYTTLRPKRVQKKVDVPEGMWQRCDECQAIIYDKDLEQNQKVCPKCGFHFRISVQERIAWTMDEGTFVETNKTLCSTDPLGFKDTKAYKDRIAALIKDKGVRDAIVSGTGKINGIPVSIGFFDFSFIGGSMGSVVGEKVTRVFELGLQKKIPAIIISQSGGARMQEGILSLMQLAKASVALMDLGKAQIPYISVLVDPSTAGIMASFGSVGDVIIAEPKAYIGFAGKRVIEQTIRQPLPPGFQTSEFFLKHGMIDLVVDRRELKKTLSQVLDLLGSKTTSIAK